MITYITIFFRYMMLNDGEVYQDRLNHLDTLASDIESVFIQHLAYIFHLRSNYMMASDHIDSLEAGLKPEEGSEYFVSPFVQEAFDKVIKPSRPDIAAAIKDATSMQLK